MRAGFSRESAWEKWLKGITLSLGAFYLVIATISGFRAIVQIYSVKISAPALLRPGISVSTIVRSSGRTWGDVTLELAQRGRVDTLGRGMLTANRNPVFDPRPRSASLAVTPTSQLLADFENGPAEIRSIARGRSQFLRVPPPRIATATVQISK